MTIVPHEPANNISDAESLVQIPKEAVTEANRRNSPHRIYVPSGTGQLRQGEILSGVSEVRVDVSGLREQQNRAISVNHPFAIVVSQDCDCEQDYKYRLGEDSKDKEVPNILLCQIVTAEELRGSNSINSTIWGQVKINKNERYHFLQKAGVEDDLAGVGLPEMGIDFKRVFTVPTDELYFRIENAQVVRRCRLTSPYLEHFATRFGYFLHRVALPLDHASDPVAT